MPGVSLRLVLCGALLGAPQEPPLAFAAVHARCVRSERLAQLQDVLADFDREVRERACADLAAQQPPGAGLAAGVPLQQLARLTRELQGAPWTAVQDFADSLDLSLTPGAFAAREDGPGEPTTVRVHALWAAPEARDFTMTLSWVSPAGERVVARTEPVERAAVRGGGFEMYVHPPAAPPGTWSLEPCIEREDGSACGVAVPVDCVRDLAARFAAAVATRPATTDPGYPLLRAADRLLRYGARESVTLRGGDLLRAFEDSAGFDAARPRLALNAAEDDCWAWMSPPPEEPRRTVCLLVSAREAADGLFAGELGRRWTAFAREHVAVLFATALPPDPSAGSTRELLDRIAAAGTAMAGTELPLVVVARGETAGRLQVALGGADGYPFDALVVSAVLRTPKPETLFPGVPRLVLSPGAVEDTAAEFFVGPGARLALFDDLDLPARVGAWLER